MKFVPVPPPIISTKRKSDEELNVEFKKQRTPQPPLMNVPAKSLSIASNGSAASSLELMDIYPTTVSSVFNLPAETSTIESVALRDFEFEAVKPLKRIFVSRLPVGITEETIRRHILKRVPTCSDTLGVSIMQGKVNANYTSITICVGHNDDAFRAINSREFWPPGTVVHQYRSQNFKHGFRPKKRNN